MNPSDKFVCSTPEACELCGREVIFEELLALYGSTILKPLRTMPNGAQTWSTAVIRAVVAKAQSEGILNDREKVEAALERLRKDKAAAKARLTAQGAPA